MNRSTISPVLLPISANDGSSSITVGSGNPSTDGKINADWYIDDYQNHFDNLYIKNSAYVYIIKVVVEQNMVVDGNSTIFAGNITVGSLSLTNTGMIYLNGGNEIQYVPLIVTGTNMTVDSTSGIYGMRAGYPGAYGTGANSNIGMTNGFTRTGGSITNAGGSHGGYGGYESTAPSNIPTVPYGNYMQPSTPGSGGGGANGGGAGGGVIRINLTGTLTVNGYLMADGAYITSDNTGGGAGGSVWITADTISGTGQIRAIGGYTLGNAGSGSGGGGRIALYYRALAGGMSISNSHFSVQGGYGPATQGGGSGTLYVKTTAATYGDLYFDNGNVVPNYLQTPFPQLGSETFTNLTVKSKATVKQLSTVTPISATNTNIKNTGAILYVPDNGAANYGSWFNPGTVTLTSGGLITEY